MRTQVQHSAVKLNIKFIVQKQDRYEFPFYLFINWNVIYNRFRVPG